ncbi:DUF1640 domain-containing protein [Duganella guangzhouensis]|nr:DUF1640 domain-containing protein [Duganella guangzhouensis]
MTISFDSHKYATRLTEAGMPPALAAIQAEMAGDIMREMATFDHRLEKTDHKIDLFKAELEVKIADSRADLIRWVVGVGLLQVSIITALLLKLVH